MPSSPSPVPTRAPAETWSLFLLLSLIWGSSFLFIELALADGVGPYTLVGLRTTFAAAFLALVMVMRGGGRPRTKNGWWRFLVLSITNIAIPFVLITWGQLWIGSGIASILNALVPLFAVVLASFVLLDEPATLSRVTGLVVGFLGVVLLTIPSLAGATIGTDGPEALIGMLAVAGASFSYAIGAVYARHRLTDEPIMRSADGSGRSPSVVEISFWQVLMAAAIVMLFAVLLERPSAGLITMPTGIETWLVLAWLGVVGTGVGYMIFFRVMASWGATRTTMVTYLIPPIAIVLGFVVLGERFEVIEIFGSALIIGGIVIVNSGRERTPEPSRSAAA